MIQGKEKDEDLGLLLEGFAVSLGVSTEANRTEAPHPRFSLYKSRPSPESSQKLRRREWLEKQKQKRFDALSRVRLLTGDMAEEEERMEKEEEGEEEESMEWKRNRLRKKGGRNRYKSQVMLSEWMVDVPEKLETEWTLVLCPVGKRCLVVASGGETKAFSRNGYLMNTFPSLLPGGSRRGAKDHKGNVILDCIFCEMEKTFYVLDVIGWNNVSFYESETDLRFYWVRTKLKEELPKIGDISRQNPYRFEKLPQFSCEKETISAAVHSVHFKCELDGLLFFHKQAHYTSEVTPLVCWLKLNMLPAILNIPVKTDEIMPAAVIMEA